MSETKRADASNVVSIVIHRQITSTIKRRNLRSIYDIFPSIANNTLSVELQMQYMSVQHIGIFYLGLSTSQIAMTFTHLHASRIQGRDTVRQMFLFMRLAISMAETLYTTSSGPIQLDELYICTSSNHTTGVKASPASIYTPVGLPVPTMLRFEARRVPSI